LPIIHVEPINLVIRLKNTQNIDAISENIQLIKQTLKVSSFPKPSEFNKFICTFDIYTIA